MYIEKHVPVDWIAPGSKAYTETHIISDSAARIDVSETDTQELIREIREKANQLPFYEFAGIGGVDPRLTGLFQAVMTNSSEKRDVWNENGILQPQFREMVLSLFAETGYFGA